MGAETGIEWTDAQTKATWKLRNIMSYLCTGWLPWGIDWRSKDGSPPSLTRRSATTWGASRDPAGYSMCCNHTLSDKSVRALIADGLIEPVPGSGTARNGNPLAIRITEKGRTWLADNWP